MSELHKFLFEGLPVRGMLVRLTDTWQDILARRSQTGAYEPALRDALGEMTAAGALLQANIKFNGAVVLQVSGDGPVKLMVAEVQPDLSLRATAKQVGSLPEGDLDLTDLINVHGRGACAITLDPKDKLPGQQPYQGVVPLQTADGEPIGQLSKVLEQYMRQSEQLDTCIVLAANGDVAAGLLIQKIPSKGQDNLEGQGAHAEEDDGEAFNRVAHLASTLTREELLTLDADTILRRLFWEEDVRRFDPMVPRFACNCSRERVGHMLIGLGREEVDSVIEEQGQVQVGCDFCGAQYRFDPVDVGQLFSSGAEDEARKDGSALH